MMKRYERLAFERECARSVFAEELAQARREEDGSWVE